MSLPENWHKVTVTGRYVGVHGQPLSGEVVFGLPVRLIHEGENLFVLPSRITATLDAEGAFSVEVPASTDPDIAPVFAYRVTERVAGLGRDGATHTLSIPHDVDTADLSELLNAEAPTAAPPEVVNLDARYARTSSENVFTRTQVIGDGLTSRSLDLVSSYEGGEDDGTGFDSTSRINLNSYQRAHFASFGEVIRIFLRKARAKAMQVWYFPQGGYDENEEPLGNFKPVVWTGAHWRSNDGLSNHKHWSIETPDPSGALQTRFEIRFGDPAVDDAIAGLAKTTIATNLADFVVRCSNGQMLRLSTPAGNEKRIEFSNDHEGATEHRRWAMRQTADAESGSNAGSNFAVSRYNDAGEFVDSPIFISRSNGRVGIGVTDPAVRMDVGDDRIRIRTPRTPATAGSFGNQGDIAWDANFLYVCVAASTWKRVAIASW